MEIPQEIDLEKAVKTAFSYNKNLSNTELAFFGGSFTAIEKDYMIMLLTKGFELVKKFGLRGIRISTRPDCIDKDILTLLKKYQVTAIELGAQSMDDDVLAMNNRGHNREDVIKASSLIKELNFELGLQMMTGLYGSSIEKDLQTAKEIAKIKPDTLRVYPTVIFKDTQLCDLYEQKIYKTHSLEDTVNLCCEIIKICEKEDINIIRLGLHSSDELKNAVAGVNHPAFTELCRSKIYLENLLEQLKDKGNYTIEVSSKELSIATGQKKANVFKLQELGFNVKFKISNSLNLSEFKILREGD